MSTVLNIIIWKYKEDTQKAHYVKEILILSRNISKLESAERCYLSLVLFIV